MRFEYLQGKKNSEITQKKNKNAIAWYKSNSLCTS